MKHVETTVVCSRLDVFFESSLYKGILTKISFPFNCLNFRYYNFKGDGEDWDIWLNQICNGCDLTILWKSVLWRSGPSWGNCNSGHKWGQPNILILKFKFLWKHLILCFLCLELLYNLFDYIFQTPDQYLGLSVLRWEPLLTILEGCFDMFRCFIFTSPGWCFWWKMFLQLC